jgi:hypothetical protein
LPYRNLLRTDVLQFSKLGQYRANVFSFNMSIDPRLHRIVAAQPYPLLFATISGAHLYGFPSPDSDYDLRGAHVLPLDAVGGPRRCSRR